MILLAAKRSKIHYYFGRMREYVHGRVVNHYLPGAEVFLSFQKKRVRSITAMEKQAYWAEESDSYCPRAG